MLPSIGCFVDDRASSPYAHSNAKTTGHTSDGQRSSFLRVHILLIWSKQGYRA